jgi:hypothetical protein
MANQFSSSGMIHKDVALLIDRAIDAVFMQRDELAGVVLNQFFDTVKINEGLDYVIAGVTSQLPFPQENEDTEALPYFTAAPGFKKSLTVTEYRAGIRVSRIIIEAQRHKQAIAMASGQAKSAARLDEYLRAAIFNNAFTGTAGADSLSLCHDSHPHENTEAGTWDNKSTGAFSGPNLHTLRLLARKMTDPQGDPDWQMPVALLIPEDLEQSALEITKSDGKPGTALNDPNVLINGLKVVVSPYLSSAVQHFLICDRKGEEKGLHEVVLSDWSIANNSPANVDIILDKRIRAVKGYGYSRSKNTIGSTGV